MRRFHVWYAIGGLAVTAALPGTLRAQGFSVNEHSTCAMGRAGTAVASPCPDGSAIYFNPAGVADAGGSQITFGGTFIAPRGSFTNDVTRIESKLIDHLFPIPNVYFTRKVSDRVGVGIGLFAPYGLTTEWSTNSEVRYLGYKSVIKNIYIQPTVAVKLNQYFSFGAGFDLDFAHLQLRQRVDLSGQQLPPPAPAGATFANIGVATGTDFADANVHGNSTGVGYHVGILIRPTDRISFGARYMSRQKVKINSGTAEFNQVSTGIILAAGNPFGVPGGTPLDAVLAPQFGAGGPLTTQTAITALRIPEQWGFGVAVSPIEKLKLLFDITLQHWQVFDTLFIQLANLPTTVLPSNFKNTTAYRFGAEYAVSSMVSLRGGYINHNGAEPSGSVTPNLPEGPRSEFTGGLGADLGGRIHGDLAYQYIIQADRRGRSVPFGQPDNGLFAFHASLFGVSFTYAF